MNTKQLRAIAIGLALLLALWGASEYFARGSDTTVASMRLPSLSTAQVDSVIITHRGETTLIAKQPGGSWVINRMPASSTAVADLFHALVDSTPELAAQDSSSFVRMGVDSPAGRLIRIAGGGKTLAQVFVGARGPAFDASYVRVPGDAHIYLWSGNLPNVAERSVDDWREKQIAAVVPESIAAIDVVRGAKRYTLRKEKAGWTISTLPKATADSAAVRRYLEQFRHLAATGFATPSQVDSLRASRPARRVVVRGNGGRDLLALALDSASTGFWARRQGDPVVYRLEYWQVDQLTPAEQGFAKK
jgi:hypothetical protein